MTAQELMAQLMALAKAPQPNTCDTCKAGDPARPVHKVALCCAAANPT